MNRDNDKSLTKIDRQAMGREGSQRILDDDHIDLGFVGESVKNHRNTLFRNMAIAVLVFVLLSVFLPKTYVARTVLLPPDQQDANPLTQLLEKTPLISLPFQGGRNYSALFVEILSSRSVCESVLKTSFKIDGAETTLVEYWELKSTDKAVKRLRRQTTLAVSEQGLIEIEVEMNHPAVAAAAANAFVAALDEINREKSVSRAKATRLYIETQLDSTSEKLQAATDSLALFQAKNSALSLEDQARTVFEQAGQLKGMIIAKEVELNLMRQSMRSGNPELSRAQSELKALKEQYAQLRRRNPDADGDLMIPISEMPQVAKRFAGLLREVKVQETVWEFLTQQYYQAKIQEARDTPTVQVLDPAISPENAAWPNPLIIVPVGVFSVAVLTVLFIVFWEIRRAGQAKASAASGAARTLASSANVQEATLKAAPKS